MNQKDWIYNTTFRELMKMGLTQKQAGDLASRHVHLWSHGRNYKTTLDQIIKDGKALVRINKKLKKAKVA